MTAPLSLTISQQNALLKKVGSRFSDNWFLSCHFKPLPLMVSSLSSAFLDWTSFSFVGDTAVFLLLTLPIIFFFQASGKQRKMTKLYSRSRLYIIFFVYTCSFSYMISPIIGKIFRQSGPCTEDVNGYFVDLGGKYQLPSYYVVLATIMSTFVYRAKFKENILAFDDDGSTIKKIFSYFFDHLLMKTIGVLVLLFFSVIECIYGRANVFQVCFSICFGLLIKAFFSLAPIFISLILVLVTFILDIVQMSSYKRPSTIPDINDDLLDIILTGISFESYACFLLGTFIYSRPNLTIFSHFYSFLEDIKVDTEDDAAAFGEFESENEDTSQDLKEILIDDLKYSAVGTLIHIICQVIQEFLTN